MKAKINPEWIALENKEYSILMIDPQLDPYKEIKIEPPPKMTFENELVCIINKHNQQFPSDTPDFILASFLQEVLTAWNKAIMKRESWYGRVLRSLEQEEISSCLPASAEDNLKVSD